MLKEIFQPVSYYWFKACTKCGGDLSLDGDNEIKCMQCGARYFEGDVQTTITRESIQRYSIEESPEKYILKHLPEITLLERGLSTKSVSDKLGIDIRSIRRVKEIYDQIKMSEEPK